MDLDNFSKFKTNIKLLEIPLLYVPEPVPIRISNSDEKKKQIIVYRNLINDFNEHYIHKIVRNVIVPFFAKKDKLKPIKKRIHSITNEDISRFLLFINGDGTSKYSGSITRINEYLKKFKEIKFKFNKINSKDNNILDKIILFFETLNKLKNEIFSTSMEKKHEIIKFLEDEEEHLYFLIIPIIEHSLNHIKIYINYYNHEIKDINNRLLLYKKNNKEQFNKLDINLLKFLKGIYSYNYEKENLRYIYFYAGLFYQYFNPLYRGDDISLFHHDKVNFDKKKFKERCKVFENNDSKFKIKGDIEIPYFFQEYSDHYDKNLKKLYNVLKDKKFNIFCPSYLFKFDKHFYDETNENFLEDMEVISNTMKQLKRLSRKINEKVPRKENITIYRGILLDNFEDIDNLFNDEIKGFSSGSYFKDIAEMFATPYIHDPELKIGVLLEMEVNPTFNIFTTDVCSFVVENELVITDKHYLERLSENEWIEPDPESEFDYRDGYFYIKCKLRSIET